MNETRYIGVSVEANIIRCLEGARALLSEAHEWMIDERANDIHNKQSPRLYFTKLAHGHVNYAIDGEADE